MANGRIGRKTGTDFQKRPTHGCDERQRLLHARKDEPRTATPARHLARKPHTWRISGNGRSRLYLKAHAGLGLCWRRFRPRPPPGHERLLQDARPHPSFATISRRVRLCVALSRFMNPALCARPARQRGRIPTTHSALGLSRPTPTRRERRGTSITADRSDAPQSAIAKTKKPPLSAGAFFSIR